MNQILFLCSGNYYRSRFAELVFNHLAAQRHLAWRAISRGFRLHPQNVGPMSPHALAGLAARNILSPEPLRFPCVATAGDLAAARRIIAVKQAEHRPMMLQWFPDWVERIEYWNIHDIDFAAPEQALPLLYEQVQQLVATLTPPNVPAPTQRPGPVGRAN